MKVIKEAQEVQMQDTIFGYFDNPADRVPDFDPGLSMACPFCLQSIAKGALKTISLMPIGGSRSYFYRAHKGCYEQATPADTNKLESSLIDAVVVK